MAPEKTTVMVLKADLQCPCCYRKIKKILCKFPQIRDQVYDEKANEVTITVVCCSPEKIRDKLCCKGGKVIKSIDIKEAEAPPKPNLKPAPPKLEEPQKPKDTPKPKEPEKPKEAPKPKEPEKPKEAPKPKEDPKPKEEVKPKEVVKPKEAPSLPQPQKAPQPEAAKPVPEAVRMMPPPEMIPVPTHGFPQAVSTGSCCGQCHDGFPGGPCYYSGGYGYGRPVPPPPVYDYSFGKPCYVSRCDYFSEENPQGCSIM